MASKNRASSTNKSTWAFHRPTIEKLYVEEKRSLEGPDGVMALMERDHGFRANKSQYEYRVSKWGKKKNIRKKQWYTIARMLAQRGSQGKATEVRFQGHLVSRDRIEREMARYSLVAIEQDAISDHQSDDLGDIAVCTPCVPTATESELPVQDLLRASRERSNVGLQQDQSLEIVLAGEISLQAPFEWIQGLPLPLHIAFEPFGWLHTLDWKMVSQLSTQSDLIRTAANKADNLFYAPATSLRNSFDADHSVAGFVQVIVAIVNNLHQPNDANIDMVHQWLGSLHYSSLRKFFGALPPQVLDTIRQQVFKAAMKRGDEVIVRAMLDIGYDVRESIILDIESLPVLPLDSALRSRNFAISKTLLTHLSQTEDAKACQNLLQSITRQISCATPHLSGKRFSLEDWTELMRIPLSKGAIPTVNCFEIATESLCNHLLSLKTKMVWLEQGLLVAVLKTHRSDLYSRRPADVWRSAMCMRIATHLLGDNFDDFDHSSPKLRLTLSEAMDTALRTFQFWAVELIHFAGFQLRPPLTSAMYTRSVRSAVDKAWPTGDWTPLQPLIMDQVLRIDVKPPPSDLYIHQIKTEDAFDAYINKAGDVSAYPWYNLRKICELAAIFEKDDMAVRVAEAMSLPAFQDRPDTPQALLILLQHRRVAVVSALIVADERWAKALNFTSCPDEFTALEDLLYRSKTMRKHRILPQFMSCDDQAVLQISLRALAYHAMNARDHKLLKWLTLTGLEMDELWHDAKGGRLKRSGYSRYLEGDDYTYSMLPSLLSIATHRNDRAMMRILIQGGADCMDSNALMEAVSTKADIGIIELLLSAAGRGAKQQYGVGAIKKAIRQGNDALVRHLADHVDINGYDANDEPGSKYATLSPLGEAIQCQDCKSTLVLINSGVNVETLVTLNGGLLASLLKRLTPLLAAIAVDSLPMAELLANARAELDHGPKLGLLRTTLQYAAELGRFDIVRYLLSKRVPADSAPFYSGATPLQLTAINGFTGVAQLLLENGANVNYPPAEGGGRTAFEGAAEWGRIDMMTLLIRWGADLDLVSRSGPLHRTGDADARSNWTDQRGTDEYGVEVVYGTQYQRALVFAEDRGEMASKRFVQHLRSEVGKGLPLLSSAMGFEGFG